MTTKTRKMIWIGVASGVGAYLLARERGANLLGGRGFVTDEIAFGPLQKQLFAVLQTGQEVAPFLRSAQTRSGPALAQITRELASEAASLAPSATVDERRAAAKRAFAPGAP